MVWSYMYLQFYLESPMNFTLSQPLHKRIPDSISRWWDWAGCSHNTVFCLTILFIPLFLLILLLHIWAYVYVDVCFIIISHIYMHAIIILLHYLICSTCKRMLISARAGSPNCQRGTNACVYHYERPIGNCCIRTYMCARISQRKMHEIARARSGSPNAAQNVRK